MTVNKSTEVKICRDAYVKDLVLVTGLSRSGKTMLAPIISSLDRAENVQFNYSMEQIPTLHDMGLMPEDTAVYLLRYAVNFMMYDIHIGRNTNLKLGDYSSIWNTRDTALYFKRIFAEEGSALDEQIANEDRIYVLMFHNALWHSDILIRAFPTIKMLNVKRHPVDLVHSWFKRGYGSLVGYGHPRVGIVTISHNSSIMPYYIAGEEDKYEKMSDIDRVINMVHKVSCLHESKYESLSSDDKKKIMIVHFDEMVEKTGFVLKKICSFLNTSESLYTPIILHNERCPRILSKEDRNIRFGRIKELASENAFNLLKSMVKEYESELA